MINNNIFNIFCFLTFSFGYFLDLVFRAFFSKFGQNTGFVKYPKEKVEKQKMLKMLLLVICEVPKKMSTIFKPFLAIFTLFHLKNWPYLQKPELGNLAKNRFWFLLVNNSLCSIPLSYARSYIKETPGDRCVQAHWSCLFVYVYCISFCHFKYIYLYLSIEDPSGETDLSKSINILILS